MTSPVLSVSLNTQFLDAVKKMGERKVGSLVVVDESNNLSGLLTSKNLIHNFFDKFPEKKVNELTVKDFVNNQPVHLPPEYPLLEALYEMQSKDEDYAVVCEKLTPVGIISSKDILRILFKTATIYETHIDNARNLHELKEIHQGLFKIAENLVENTRYVSDVLTILSSIHLKIQRKVYEISANVFFENNRLRINVKNIPHALIIMGSGGRREMSLDPDQDNGFIISDKITDIEKEYLNEFGKMLIENLAYVGYEKCEGNVMVTNPDMSKTLTQWKKDISEWIENPGKWGIRWSSILFDFDCLVGDEKLVWELREFILRKISLRPAFLMQILQSDSTKAVPISLFGGFVTEKKGKYKGTFNLKRTGLMFIVDIARVFSLYKGISDLNTKSRLKHLERLNVLSEETVQNVLEAYEIMTNIILLHQIEQAKNNEKLDKFINPKKLSVYKQERLKEALKTVSKFLDIAISYFGGSPF
jgi:CBS domain-containing protein